MRVDIVSFKIKPEEAALLVIDMQNDFVNEKGAGARLGSALAKLVRENGVIEKTRKVIEAARDAAIPVFHVATVYRQDGRDSVGRVTDTSLKEPTESSKDLRQAVEGTWGAEFVDELKPQKGDYVVIKKRSSAFYNTDLELLLRARDARLLIVTGIATNACVYSTVRSALDRDFTVLVVTDATGTGDEEAQQYWVKSVFPWLTVTMKADEFAMALKKVKA